LKTQIINKNIAIILLLGGILFISGCGGDEDDTTTLKVADSVPESNYISKDGISYWMDRVEELTEGEVEFEYYPSEQLGDADSLLDATKSKTTDIGYVSYAEEDLPLTQITQLPGALESSSEGSEVIWELANDDIMLDEFLEEDVRPVFAATLTPDQIATTDVKIKGKEDLNSLKVRSAGGITDFTANIMGVTPVSMPAPEMYTAMERGTVDGSIVNLTSFTPYQLEEVSGYSTKNANFGSFGVYYAINEDVYQDLDDDEKEALITAGDETVEHFSETLDEDIDELTGELDEEGVEMYDLDSNLKNELNTEFEEYWNEWSQNLDDKGYPASKLLNNFEEELQ